MLAAALQGLDAFVFTAGIGENSMRIRARIVDQLRWLGVTLSADENSRDAQLISRSDSRIPVYVIPTDEELMIAKHTLSLLLERPSPGVRHERASSILNFGYQEIEVPRAISSASGTSERKHFWNVTMLNSRVKSRQDASV